MERIVFLRILGLADAEYPAGAVDTEYWWDIGMVWYVKALEALVKIKNNCSGTAPIRTV
jgi:hypothetical protein